MDQLTAKLGEDRGRWNLEVNYKTRYRESGEGCLKRAGSLVGGAFNYIIKLLYTIAMS